MGFSRQEYWSESPCPPPGNLPNVGIEPAFLSSPALDSLPLLPPRKPNSVSTLFLFCSQILFHYMNYHVTFIHLLVNRHLVCLCHLNFMNYVVYIPSHANFFCFISHSYMCKSRISESYGNSIFNILRKCHTIFQSDSVFTSPLVVYENSNFSTTSSTLITI